MSKLKDFYIEEKEKEITFNERELEHLESLMFPEVFSSREEYLVALAKYSHPKHKLAMKIRGQKHKNKFISENTEDTYGLLLQDLRLNQ